MTTHPVSAHPDTNDRHSGDDFACIFEMIRQPIIVLDTQLRIVSANRTYYDTFQQRPRQIEGESFYEIGDRGWDRPELRKRFAQILPLQSNFDTFRAECEFPKIGRRTFTVTVRHLTSAVCVPARILVVLGDSSIAEPDFSVAECR